MMSFRERERAQVSVLGGFYADADVTTTMSFQDAATGSAVVFAGEWWKEYDVKQELDTLPRDEEEHWRARGTSASLRVLVTRRGLLERRDLSTLSALCSLCSLSLSLSL